MTGTINLSPFKLATLRQHAWVAADDSDHQAVLIEEAGASGAPSASGLLKVILKPADIDTIAATPEGVVFAGVYAGTEWRICPPAAEQDDDPGEFA